MQARLSLTGFEMFVKYVLIIHHLSSWLGMIIRAVLCALDWNANVGRPQKLDEFGKPLFREKVRNLKFEQVELEVPNLKDFHL